MMVSFIDPMTGRMPNTGSNDGAFLFALSECGYEDFRPAVQWAFAKLENRRAFLAGTWDETAKWFGCALPAAVETSAAEIAPEGGYYRLSGKNSWGMLRCAKLKDRPFQADQLHLDIFHNGKAVLLDPGTYAYNPQPPDRWDNPLTSAKVHNTVTIDGREPMTRAGRFLWLDWDQGKILKNDSHSVIAEHDGYQPAVHRRSVNVEGDQWTVTDEMLGSGEHELELHWLVAESEPQLRGSDIELSDVRLTISSSAPCALRLVRAGERIAGEGSAAADQYRGWYAPAYRVREPAVSVVAKMKANLPAKFTTVICLREQR
jgi:asparagine synthase (glutamine-hydrolysing)